MTVISIGNDILEISRFRKLLKEQKEALLSRLFTKKEQAYCLKYKDPVPHFAARFSAKESIAKALGCGIGKKLSWKEIEILNTSEGKPEVFFSSSANARWKHPKVIISLSHCKSYVATVALYLG